MSGQDRFVADLRPLTAEGSRLGLCCHPYDLSTEMIARELGVIITDAAGLQLTAPLELEPNVAWVGYANAGVRTEIEPLLQTALKSGALSKMYRIIHGPNRESHDVSAFLRGWNASAGLFERGRPIFVARAPGQARSDGRHRRLFRLARA